MSLKLKTFDQALHILRILGTKFIVIDPDGKTHMHGDLKLAPSDVRTRKQVVPMGTYKNIYYPHVKDLPVGGCASFTVPDELDIDGLRGSMSAWCSKHWGNGNYCTEAVDRVIEVLRVK